MIHIVIVNTHDKIIMHLCVSNRCHECFNNGPESHEAHKFREKAPN